MEFQERYVYPAPIEKVWEMFANPAYSELRAKKLMMTDPQVRSTATDSEIEVTTTGGVPQGMLPAAAKRFISPSTQVVLAEEWRRVGAGRISGSLSVSAQGVPAGLTSTVVLEADGNQTNAVMKGDVKVQIPLLGRRLEAEAVKFAPELVKGERQTAEEFLAR